MAEGDQNDLFKGINPEELSPELQALYKSMQSDYTKKTTDLANKTKEWEAKEQQYIEQVKNSGALEQEVNQWRGWYQSLADQNDDDNGRDDAAADTRTRATARISLGCRQNGGGRRVHRHTRADGGSNRDVAPAERHVCRGIICARRGACAHAHMQAYSCAHIM